MTAVLQAPRRGVRLWYSVTAGIGWWMVHLTALAALSSLACEHSAAVWTMHGLTIGLALLTLQATAWCALLVRDHTAPEEDASADGRLRFLGLFGLLTGATSVVLIVWEGVYAMFLDACS